MEAERWQRIQDLFEAALEQESSNRESYLLQACAGDNDLFLEVKSLLHADQSGHSLLDGQASDVMPIPSEIEMEGKLVGAYRIVRQIGTGGMGAVYLAERADGHFQQQVALKLIRRGMDSDIILRRFQAERQILARLQHPNIARLLDGGRSSDGRPFFTLEYVEGEPIDRYCDRMKLSIDKRLQLFVTVCQAVQYAQESLVVHRDLKPGNILVTKEGEVKLLDFGIAKLVGIEGEDQPPADMTRTGLRVMTPGYASPEQVRGEPVTTATDVYSLGVILFELLAGSSPYQLTSQSLPEVERVICTTAPQKPSTVALRSSDVTPEKVSACRGTQPARLRRKLSGDLDNICLMALRKEPERRYRSAERLADDILRHLSGRPVVAQADSFKYRTGKFLRRHRVGALAASAVLLIVGSLVTFYTVRLADERNRAQLEAAKATQVSDFLSSLFEVSDPEEARGETITARELLSRGRDKIETELKDQPEVRGSMMAVMAGVYNSMGLYKDAVPLYDSALVLQRKTLDKNDLDLARTLNGLGRTLCSLGEYDRAEELLREGLKIRRSRLGEMSPEVARSIEALGWLINDLGDVEAAEPLYREAVQIWSDLPGETRPEVGLALNNLALLLHEKSDYQTADSLFRKALTLQRELLGEDHPEVATTLYNLGQLLRDKGELEASEKMLREGLAIDRKVYGEKNPYVAYSLTSLGLVLQDEGLYKQAGPLFREALEIRREQLGEDHPNTTASINALARLLHDEGKFDSAKVLYQEVLDMRRKFYGDQHRSVATSLNNLGWLYYDEGDFAKAEEIHRQALALNLKLNGEKKFGTAISMLQLARDVAAQGDIEQADSLLRQALESGIAIFGEEHPFVATIIGTRAGLKAEKGSLEAAAADQEKVVAILNATVGGENRRTSAALGNLALTLRDLDQLDSAEGLARRALEIREKLLRPDHPSVATGMVALGSILTEQGLTGEAEPLLRKANSILAGALDKGHWSIAIAQGELGNCLAVEQRFEEAEGLLLESLKTLQLRRGKNNEHTRRVRQQLQSMYEAWGKPQQAALYAVSYTH